MAKVCLIVPHHVAMQPRTVREADTLARVGHEVRVVSRQVDVTLGALDHRLMAKRRWRLQTVDLRRMGPARRAWLVESARSRLSAHLFELGIRTPRLAAAAYISGTERLLALALTERADWYISHTQAALPIAAVAARRTGARLGFDCEDLLAERGTEPARIVRMLERTYVSECAYVSAPSRHVAERLKQQYRMPAPVVLYNTFPVDLAEGLPSPERRTSSPSTRLRLYWFGQTLGPGRGIEEAIATLGRLEPSDAELHLRGRVAPEFQRALDTLASEHGVRDRLVLHPLVPHDDTIRTAGEFDVGLALERPENVNTSLTVSNKLFAYLLAGLAVAATDTPGQREILDQIPSAGIVCPPDQPADLAFGIRAWARNRAALLKAQQQAWRAARERFSWDREEQVFLRLFEDPTGGPVS